MAYQKLQVGRALPAVESNTIDIPNPSAEYISSTSTGASALKLVDTAGDFINKGVKIGDIINTAALASEVTAIDSATQLSVTTAIPTTTAYKIYAAGQNQGCVLYVGGAGTVEVETVGGDSVTFSGVNAGTFLPVQVLKLKAGTGATLVLALW